MIKGEQLLLRALGVGRLFVLLDLCLTTDGSFDGLDLFGRMVQVPFKGGERVRARESDRCSRGSPRVTRGILCGLFDGFGGLFDGLHMK